MSSHMYLLLDPAVAAGTTATGQENAIEILSWSHGFSQPTSPTRSSAGAGTVEQAHHSNLSLTKYMDAATAGLLKLCWQGQQIKTATLQCFRAGGDANNAQIKYLEVVMEHVLISNYSLSGGGGDLPVENLSLDYGTLKYTYTEQQHTDGAKGGNMSASHNLETRVVA